MPAVAAPLCRQRWFLKALLLQILFSIRSEHQLVEVVNYNLL
jgi:transposase